MHKGRKRFGQRFCVETLLFCIILGMWSYKDVDKTDIGHIREATGSVIESGKDDDGEENKVSEEEEKQDTEPAEHDGLVVGMAGRINRWKGQKLFVDAAQKVHEILPEVRFQIAGEAYSGEEKLKEDLIAYIAEKKLEDTVILLGQVNDMPSFYRGLDLFVLPSIQPEPFGLVVIEAMEYGIPVIATNHGGPAEILDDGVDGYLVDYQNADQMAARIVELMSDAEKRKSIGERGQEKKRREFSVSAMVGNIETIFEEDL